MMMRKLRLYLWWKRQVQKQGEKHFFPMPDSNRQAMEGFDRIFAEQDGISEALKKKDKEKAARAQSRRRVRGGGPAAGSSIPKPEPKEPTLYPLQNEADEISRLYVCRSLLKNDTDPRISCSWDSQNEDIFSVQPLNLVDNAMGVLDLGSVNLESEFDVHYGLLAPEETVIVRAYSDDTDDQILQEIKPKFIVMFEPDMDFVRRIEVGATCSVYEGSLIDTM